MTTGVAPAAAGRYGDAVPAITGRYDADVAVLERHTGEAEAYLAGLPGKPERDGGQHDAAARVLAGCRVLRDRFVAAHAVRLYRDLTGGGSRRPRLDEVVFGAADACPGLVPTRAQMAAEDRLIQAEKEGREIDQGILVRGLLRVPEIGAHLLDTMRMPAPWSAGPLERFRRDGEVELDTLDVRLRDGIASVTFRNTHCLNAEDARLIRDMETAADLVLLDDRARVGLLRGGEMTHPRHRGRRVFSAGINLSDLRNGRIPFLGFLLGRELGYLSKLIRGVYVPEAADPEPSVQKPWVAAVDSFAIGGGMQLLLAVDHVVAADDAYASLPAAKEGIVPGAGNLRLSRLTGARLARGVILGGRRILATDPEAALIFDQVVPAGEVGRAAHEAAVALDNPAVAANRRMLGLAEEGPDRFREYMAEFAYVQAVRLYSTDVIDKVDRAWSRAGDRGN